MDVELELLATGYGLGEGPRTDDSGALWYTDIRGGTVHRRDPDGTIETVLEGRESVGGLAVHADGGLVMSGPTVVHWKDGELRPLLELDGVVAFNDLHTDSQGRVYVGAIRCELEDLRNEPDPKGECYRIELDGSITELYGDVGVSNGIGFSPDGSILYHVDSTSRGIWAHDIDADGQVSNRRHLGRDVFQRGIPDGMCVDEQGNLWVAHVGPGRVAVLNASGELIDEVNAPAKWVTSCAFGGPDRQDLYIVSADNTDDESLRGCVWKCRPGATGVATPLARV